MVFAHRLCLNYPRAIAHVRYLGGGVVTLLVLATELGWGAGLGWASRDRAATATTPMRLAQASGVVNRPTLKVGSRGESVSELQAALKLLGFYTGEVDGIYGDGTAAAVTDFQRSAGVKPDGIVNATTWTRLFPPLSAFDGSTPDTPPPASTPRPSPSPEAARPAPSKPTKPAPSTTRPPTKPSKPATTRPAAAELPTLREGMRGDAVERLQTRLRAIGVYDGEIDGIFGPATLEAVKAAQEKFDLEPDGIVGTATWSAILR